MLHKTFDLLESKTDAQAGTFEATVAVFGNVDRGGDRIMPGAFDETLAKWRESGDPIPIILSHQWDNPMAHIGVADPNDVVPTTKGLHVKGKLDIADNDVAKQVHRLMARRSLKEFSFGYEVPKGGQKRTKDGVNELYKIELAEAGPTLKGMNPATELHAVKTALDEETQDWASHATDRKLAEHTQLPELQEVKARLEKIEKALEDLSSKADETEAEATVDLLRNDAQRIALEVRSDGLSANPPVKQAVKEEPKPDQTDPDELRRHARSLMLQVLSGDTHE